MHKYQRGLLGAIALLGLATSSRLVHYWLKQPWAIPTPSLAASEILPEAATQFLVVAGGGAPSYNEIALEKNVRYFQRTLAHLGWNPAQATTLFANGHDGQPTVRYLDSFRRERFKVPDIPNLTGAATTENVQAWLQAPLETVSENPPCATFVYFTGHGALNRQNPDNNALILWEEELLSVQALAQQLDQWPTDRPFVTMMAQCYAGSFANLIYAGGNPTQPLALHTRCGFFATVKTRPSVGCTPEVNEADYRDYSSSFFAGMSGQDRVGNPVPSADYDGNGEVSFAEAHAFAKVDAITPDWPVSTSEAWLQRQASSSQETESLELPLQVLAHQARPEQRHVIETLAGRLGYPLETSFAAARPPEAGWFDSPQAVLTAYYKRLEMEVIAVGIEAQIRASGNQDAVDSLQKLLDCESSTWE